MAILIKTEVSAFAVCVLPSVQFVLADLNGSWRRAVGCGCFHTLLSHLLCLDSSCLIRHSFFPFLFFGESLITRTNHTGIIISARHAEVLLIQKVCGLVASDTELEHPTSAQQLKDENMELIPKFRSQDNPQLITVGI